MASDEGDELVLRTGYQMKEYNAEEIAIENKNLKQGILQQRQKLTDARKRTNERLKKEYEEVTNQLRMEETDSLSSQTKLKCISSLQDQDFKGLSWNSTGTIRSHSENSDYIVVKSCNNPSHRLSLISDNYESVGSVPYASTPPGKYIQQATKRRFCCLYKVLFALLCCACILLTVFLVLLLKLSGSDDSATTQIKSSCIPCNMSEVKDETDKTCCGRNFTESSIESDGAGRTAHFVSCVDIAFLERHLFPSKMHKHIPEWQGTLYRNRTFATTAAPLTLRFFKEADWMENSTTVKIFDFDKKTGKFTAKHTGLYYIYALAQFRISREQGIAMTHRSPSGFEKINEFRCGTNEFTDDILGIGKPCTLGGVVQMKENEFVEIQLLDEMRLLSVNPDHMYFGAFLLHHV